MQIHTAAKRGDIDGLKYCLSRGVPVDRRDRTDDTPLIAALHSLYTFDRPKGPKCGLTTVHFLLDAGADINAVGQLGRTPLHLAASSGQPQLVRFLCERGADPHLRAKGNFTTLVSSCFQPPSPAKLEIIQFLAGCGVPLDDASSYKESPVSTCYRFGDFEGISLLLDLGASPLPLEWNELHRLTARGTPAELGRHHSTAAELAGKGKRWEITPFLLAVKMGDVAKISKLAELGSPLDQPGRLGASPLHIAAEHDRAEAVAWLLKSAGANAESADRFGKTPLMIACENDSVRTVELLLDAGAAIEANEKRAINEARSEKAMKLLAEKGGADINSIDDSGSWPLAVAAAANDTAWVDWLIRHGAQIDLTSTGATALHSAICADAREAAQLLLQHGADPNAQDVDLRTPLFETQSREAIQLLLGHGADPTITDQCGWLPKAMGSDEDPLLKELLQV